MHNRDRAVMAGLLVVSALAVAGATMMVASGRVDLYLASGSLAILAIVEITVVMLVWPRLADQDSSLAETRAAVHGLFQRTSAAESRLAHLGQQVAELQAAPADTLLEEVRNLRESVAVLAREMAQPPSAAAPVAPPAPVAEPPPKAQPLPPPPKAQPLPPREHLDFLLEPVIELNSGDTMHYRAQIAMVGEGGTVADYATLMDKAETGGMRPALELRILKHALPALRRLRFKHPNLRLLAPIGAATLNNSSDFIKFMAALEIERDAAAGIVFDLQQSDIGQLNAEGIEGLARLARAGTVLALSGIAAEELDLASLRQLGVRYLIADAGLFDAGFGASPAWKQFSQYARAMQFQLMAGNVTTAQQASAATRLARFGYGPFFAPPRRVKADAGQSAATWQERAA